MTTRDEYVEKMKAQLDQWNIEVARWEAKAKDAEAGMKADYEKQLEHYRSQRDQALYTLHQLQVASTGAWQDMMRGVDEAWKRMSEAMSQARSHFDKKP